MFRNNPRGYDIGVSKAIKLALILCLKLSIGSTNLIHAGDFPIKYNFNAITAEGWLDDSQSGSGAGPDNYEIIPDPDNSDNNVLRIETAANSNERPKVATQDNTFGAGQYIWRVFTPVMAPNERGSIGAFIFKDCKHEIDFEIFHGKQADRDTLNAGVDDLIAQLTVQSQFKKQVLIKRDQWHLLELNLKKSRFLNNQVYIVTWKIDGIEVGNTTVDYGPEILFSILCSLEILDFTGDNPPTQDNFTLFDFVEFIPEPPGDPYPLDSDDDGMSDIWEIEHFENKLSEATENPDGDNQNNLVESMFGTDPLDAQSFQSLGLQLNNNMIQMNWDTIQGISYKIDTSANLMDWSNFRGAPFESVDGSAFLVSDNELTGDRKFFRLRAAVAVDQDGDGLNAWEESILGTSDTDIDSDDDTMTDLWEFENGLDPLVANNFDPALAALLQNELVAQYRFDEGSGSIVNDSSVNNFHATVTNLADWVTDSIRQTVFRLSKTEDNLVTLPPGHSILDNLQNNNYTLSLWFNPSEVPTNSLVSENSYALLMKRGRHNGLKFTHQSRLGSELWLRVSDTKPNVNFELSSAIKTINQWYHTVMAVDKSAGKVSLYVNGTLENERNFDMDTPTISYSGPWRIGATSPNTSDTYRWQTNGLIDDVRIYSRTLIASEVLSLFAIEEK